MSWHNKSVREVLKTVGTSSQFGLEEGEAKKRLADCGENKLAEQKKTPLLIRFFMQFNDFMVIILIIAAVISFFVEMYEGNGEFVDPIIIMAIVILNAIIGLVQENKAERALEALKNMSAPHTTVVREGVTKEVETSKLVVGDIIKLKQGDYIPADCRLIESINLKIMEANLTGESQSVDKNADTVLKRNDLLGDRVNMVFMGTNVSMGRGLAVVVETGMQTEIGRIATLIMDEKTEDTPLQKKLAQTGKVLGIGALLICFVIFGLGILRQVAIFDMFMTSVSLAVAAIPEGLPAIVTIMLAMGVQSMAEKKAVVKKLPAVETLGSATVICSDKTGTLTQNKMTVKELIGDESEVLRLGGLCTDVVVEDGKAMGEPTELAIVMAGLKRGIEKNESEKDLPRVAEIPFESERKLMSTIHKNGNEYIVIVKGAPEILLERCKFYKQNGIKHAMSVAKRIEIKNAVEDMAENALRVLGVCCREMTEMPKKIDNQSIENELTFLGLVGIIDPPREEVPKAVLVCKKAGIKPVMITGDNLITAKAIAKEIGILEKNDKCISGEELNRITQEELNKNIYNYSVFARVSPEHKVMIVNAFKSRGEVVAMTGDGVNDAPALKAADIGCAMGISGTDVAKEAADMVLTDDNFATIVEAVREGRGIYNNIKKSVHFLLSSNIGEILTIFVAMVIGFVSPLVAIQLLWVNLVTDSMPAIALGLDPQEDNVMLKRAKNSGNALFTKEMWARIVLEGAMIGSLALVAFAIGQVLMGGENVGRTMAFATLSISQLVHAFNMRSEGSIFNINMFGNLYLVGALVLGVILQVSVIQIEFLSNIFKVVTLGASQWLIVLVLCVMPIVIVEIEKIVNKCE